jgi:hypothetical protein
LYRRVASLGLAMVAAWSAASAAHAADPARCREASRKFEISKSDITAIEVSLTLFAAADKNCVELATELLDQGASVDARGRSAMRPAPATWKW